MVDQIPVDEDEWVVHYDVHLNQRHTISKRNQLQLKQLGVTHHRLGHTFP